MHIVQPSVGLSVKHLLGPVDGLLEIGQIRLVDIGQRRVLLVRSGSGDYYALRHLCAHQGVDLSAGRLTGRLKSLNVGEYEYVDDFESLRCPRHGYQYDVRSGQTWFDTRVRIKTYVVTVYKGELWVDL